MAIRIPYVFATTGDTTSVPDTSTGTELSWQAGWSPAYELAPEEPGYREIDRGQHNFLWNAITANIKEWQDQSFPAIVSSVDYPVGSITVYSGLPYVKFQNIDGATDDPSASNDWKVFDGLSESLPLNNDWNGYLDPEHQSSLPSAGGYPGNSGGGEVVYPADTEISHGIFSGSGGATVSSDADGWIISAGSIYKLNTFTDAQLADIDVTTVPVFLKNQDGTPYFVKHNGSTINVTKPSATMLKVEITSGIFAGLSITKLWRFFVTEKVGYVVELSPDTIERLLITNFYSTLDVTLSRSPNVTYTNGSRPRQVCIHFNGTGPGARTLTITKPGEIPIGITRYIPNTSNASVAFDIIIPPFADYMLDGTFVGWLETV